MTAGQHFVYIVRCANGTLYTGYSTNVEKCVSMHNTGKGARYTRAHLPVVLCAVWSFSTKGDALRAEWAIKGLPRAKKVQLIEQAQQGEESTIVNGLPMLIAHDPSQTSSSPLLSSHPRAQIPFTTDAL